MGKLRHVPIDAHYEADGPVNRLFLYTLRNGEIAVLVGSKANARRTYLKPEQAAKLAHKLMSLAAGGDTNGHVIELGKDFGE